MATTAKPYPALTEQIQRPLDSIIEMAIQVDRAGVTQVPLRSRWTIDSFRLLSH
ncbi:hypothetical protein [Arthrobacter sp. HMSC06H05]|uniref:hypothetical protein n=1 Tax=Arthrobacter sp. HMSC06H05 TaxID=1581128 RepID=UPI00159F621C|nr:hypothetical protein [Arthrobacter sp. HMSC06H05]